MCIVAIKPQGVHRPSDEMFQSMCTRNRDGFGMVTWSKENGLVVKKTMKEEEYMEWVHEVDDATPAIFHMRIATHGSVGTKNCHPFISKKNDWAFAHNGILSIENEKDMTDSETFFRRIALPIINSGYPPATKVFDAMVASLIGSSKFAFINKDGQIYTYGNFIKHETGLMFSNSSYETWQPAVNVKSIFEDWNGYSGNYSHDWCGYGGKSVGKPQDNADDIAECYADLYDSMSYDNSYTQGMSDGELYEAFGRTYGLTRATFRETLKLVKEDIDKDAFFESFNPENKEQKL